MLWYLGLLQSKQIANGIAIGYKASVTTGSTDGGVAIGSYSVAKQELVLPAMIQRKG